MTTARYTATWALLALMALCAPVWADSFGGKVVSVTDGDTIQVMRDGKAEKIRLHGVDTPESNQDFGTKAKQFTSEMVFGKYVTVDVVDTDRYGRLVGVVISQDGSNLNHELVRNGMAWWYRQYAAGDTTLQQLESSAKASNVGLWSMPNPIAPWDFRRGKTSPNTTQPGTTPTGVADRANPSTGPPSTSDNVTGEVYITASGKKYHSDGCRYLTRARYHPHWLTLRHRDMDLARCAIQVEVRYQPLPPHRHTRLRPRLDHQRLMPQLRSTSRRLERSTIASDAGT